MKKIFSILIAIFSFQISVAQVPNYIPTTGLIGWYPFTGNANDGSINSNDGTAYGATLTQDRDGVMNQAYHFDGNDEIRVPSSTSLESFTNAFTISAWVKINQFNSNGIGQFPVIDKNISCPPTSGTTPFLLVAENGAAGYDVQNINCGVQTMYGSSGTQPQTNQWTHVVAVYDGMNIKMYVDNILLGTNPNSGNIVSSTGELSIGHTMFGCNCSWANGDIDDIGIWNQALNENEIDNIFNSALDTCFYSIYDTITTNITVWDTSYITINVYDTIDVMNYDTTFTTVFDTIPVYDTTFITVYDTIFIIDTLDGIQNRILNNTIKIFPNPTSGQITIDNGNYLSMNGYQLQIVNSLGQKVFESPIDKRQFVINLSPEINGGIYYVNIIDPHNRTVDNRKIVVL